MTNKKTRNVQVQKEQDRFATSCKTSGFKNTRIKQDWFANVKK